MGSPEADFDLTLYVNDEFYVSVSSPIKHHKFKRKPQNPHPNQKKDSKLFTKIINSIELLNSKYKSIYLIFNPKIKPFYINLIFYYSLNT